MKITTCPRKQVIDTLKKMSSIPEVRRELNRQHDQKRVRWFVENHDMLVNLYKDKYVVIANKEAVASAETLEQGIDKALDLGLDLGSFIVQLCTEGDSAYTQKFYSRAIFA